MQTLLWASLLTPETELLLRMWTCAVYLVTLCQPSLGRKEPKSIPRLVGENKIHLRWDFHFTWASATGTSGLLWMALRKGSQWGWERMKLRTTHSWGSARQGSQPASRNCQSLDGAKWGKGCKLKQPRKGTRESYRKIRCLKCLYPDKWGFSSTIY